VTCFSCPSTALGMTPLSTTPAPIDWIGKADQSEFYLHHPHPLLLLFIYLFILHLLVTLLVTF
jgi:hypothetical protein